MCHGDSGWTVPFKASPLALKANTGPSTGNIFNFSYHPNNKQETLLQFCLFHFPLATDQDPAHCTALAAARTQPPSYQAPLHLHR